jgi:iron complex transport system substrate-binding protein
MSWRWAGCGLLALVVACVGPACNQSTPPATAEAQTQLPKKPMRIASMTLASDELLAPLVSPDRLVCVTYLADDPQISNVSHFYPTQVPRLREADVERIVTLAPDLVCVAPYNSPGFLDLIQRSGIPIYRNQAYHSIDQIEAGIEKLGQRLGETDRAAKVIAEMRARRAELARQLAGLPRRPRVLYWTAGFTSGRDTTTDDIIREAGGTNVADQLGLIGNVEISPEQVIAANPDYILLSRWSADERDSRIENHPLLRELSAVREKRCLVIEGRYLSTLSQYVVAGAEQLARQLHPDRFRSAASPAPASATGTR